MNLFSTRFTAEFAELLTAVLMHFVWQGVVLTLMLLVLVQLLNVRTARLRYLLSVGTLLMMAMAPFRTICLHFDTPALPRLSREASGHSTAIIEERSTSPLVVHPAPNLKQTSATPWNPSIEVTVLIAWLAGVLFFSTRLAIGFGVTLWLRAKLEPLTGQFEQRVHLLGERLGVNARHRVFACSKVGQAVAVGFVRPIVLIPVAWLTQLSPEMLEAVIAHELAHIRRWDLWVNLVQRIIETLLFYHPAVWWLSRRIRLEREMCCDEIAASCFDRAMYARSLESVARIAHGDLLMASSINGGNKMKLLSRIRYLLGGAPADAAGNWWAVGFVALVLPFAAVVGFSILAGSTPLVAIAKETPDESKAIEKAPLLGGKDEADEVATAHTVEQQIDQIINRFLGVLRQKKLAFLKDEDCSKIGDDLRADLLQRMRHPLPKRESQELLRGMELLCGPKSGHLGELFLDAARLADDIDMFSWYLWTAVTPMQLTEEDLARREAQREWMRNYLKELPDPDNGRVGKWRLPDGTSANFTAHEFKSNELEEVISNPLNPFFAVPLSEKEFEDVQSLILSSKQFVHPTTLGSAPSAVCMAVTDKQFQKIRRQWPKAGITMLWWDGQGKWCAPRR